MKETLTKPKKKDGLFGGLNLNILDILKSNRDNAENEEAISNGGEIAKKGSELIARFHSIYEHIFYQGYENYDKINKVAKFFETGNYAKALRESGHDCIREFVKDERRTIAGLKEAVDFDLGRLSKYNDQVAQEIEAITKFIDENTHDGVSNPSNFKESITEGRLSELFEIKESLIHIQSVLSVTINSAIDGKRLLTVASDSVLQNISMIASIGPEDAKKAWSGTYKVPVEDKIDLEQFAAIISVVLFVPVVWFVVSYLLKLMH